MSKKENIISNIIALNPTGTLNFNGTYEMNGQNNIVVNSNSAAKDNLEKTQSNKIVCSAVEKFENYNNIEKKNYKNYYFILFIIFIILAFYILYLFSFKKIK